MAGVDPSALPVTQQSVPTGIAIAPDGSLTVSEYTYFPYPEGEARIFSVDPNTLQSNVIADGFTQLTGVAYDPDGNLYALQHINSSEWKEIQQGGIITGDISGSLIKIATDGTRETIWSGDGLEAASGITYGPDGNLYIANRARLAGTGQVIKIDPESNQSPRTYLCNGSDSCWCFRCNFNAEAQTQQRISESRDCLIPGKAYRIGCCLTEKVAFQTRGSSPNFRFPKLRLGTKLV